MPNRTRRPKIQSDDLQVAGLQQRKDEPPRWERDLIGPFLEKLLPPNAGSKGGARWLQEVNAKHG